MGSSLKNAGLCAAVLFAILASPGSAQADPDPKPDTSAPEQDQAVGRYIEGERHYAAGRYELAVQEFEAALALSGRPELHFNIANCLERAGEYTRAAESLEKFLASGNAPEPEILRERIWRLKRRGSEQEAKVASLVEEGVRKQREEDKKQQTPPPALEATPVSARKPSYLPAYITLASGGAIMLTGFVYAGLSRSAGNDAADGCIQRLCSDDVEDSLEKEHRYAQVADIAVLAGLATAGVGGYLWYRANQESNEGLQVAPLTGPETVGVWLSAPF